MKTDKILAIAAAGAMLLSPVTYGDGRYGNPAGDTHGFLHNLRLDSGINQPGQRQPDYKYACDENGNPRHPRYSEYCREQSERNARSRGDQDSRSRSDKSRR